MSQNKTIKQGDLVRYHRESSLVTSQGFKLGQVYEVKKSGARLRVEVDTEGIYLTDANNELTDSSDHFTLVKDMVKLPKGNGKT